MTGAAPKRPLQGAGPMFRQTLKRVVGLQGGAEIAVAQATDRLNALSLSVWRLLVGWLVSGGRRS